MRNRKVIRFHVGTDVTGLGLKASPGGSKQYILQSRLESDAPIRLTMGKLNAWSIEDARAEARRLQGLIDQGRDLRQQKAELAEQDKAAREQASSPAQGAKNLPS